MENHLVDFEPRLLRKVGLCDVVTHELFNDKLKMYSLNLKMMEKKSIGECENVIEEWSYLLKNLESMEEKLKQYPQYDDLFDAAEAEEKGRGEGLLRGAIKTTLENAKKMLAEGLSKDMITRFIGRDVDKLLGMEGAILAGGA